MRCAGPEPLEATTVALQPFEVVKGVRHIGRRRCAASQYTTRLVGDVFGKDVDIPGIKITYHIQPIGGGSQSRDHRMRCRPWRCGSIRSCRRGRGHRDNTTDTPDIESFEVVDELPWHPPSRSASRSCWWDCARASSGGIASARRQPRARCRSAPALPEERSPGEDVGAGPTSDSGRALRCSASPAQCPRPSVAHVGRHIVPGDGQLAVQRAASAPTR